MFEMVKLYSTEIVLRIPSFGFDPNQICHDKAQSPILDPIRKQRRVRVLTTNSGHVFRYQAVILVQESKDAVCIK